MSSLLEPPRTLKSVCSAPEYFRKVSEVVERIGSSCDEMELVRLLRQGSMRVGADDSFFVSFMREDASFESHRIPVACNPLWSLGYEHAACYANDPWLAYAARCSEPIRGSEFTFLTDRERTVVQLAERFGFRSAVIVPAPTGGGLSRLGMLVLGSESDGYFEGEGFPVLRVVARSVAMELHERHTALIGQELRAHSKVTEEDLQLLAYERQGQGTKSIARLTGASCEAIDTRFRRVNVKLRAPNRMAAAKLAAEYGLI
ncbi:MAG: autoinducer binding domain-containing protein [Acidobacteriota bacterium]|nr:autoinducer binding domain-containing protein [Acidobacteriota bacterium]